MRIGQILIEAELISAKQLSAGLEYGKSKGIFLGRAMKLLNYLQEPDVERALKAQKLIRLGLSPVVAIEALKRAVKENLNIEDALQERYSEQVSELGLELDSPSIVIDKSASPEQLVANGDKHLIEDECRAAEANYLAALELLIGKLGQENLELCPVLVRLGNTYMATDRYSEAENCYTRVLDLRSQLLEENHPQIAQALDNLADLFRALAKDQQATDFYLRALDVLEGHLPSQLSSYASVLRKVTSLSAKQSAQNTSRQLPVGELLKAAGILSEAQVQSALRMSKQSNIPVGVVLRENCMVTDREMQSALKAQFCLKHGILTEALAVDLLARASRREISMERLLHEAGVLASDESKYETYHEIAIELDRLVAVESSSVGSQKDAAPIAFKLGALYEQVGDSAQAEIYYSRALRTWGSEVQGDLSVARTCTALARIQQSQNRNEEVVSLLSKALEHREHALGANHEETISTLEELAEAEIEKWELASAFKHLQQALEARERLAQEGSKLLKVVVLLGDCHSKRKEYEEAKNEYNRAMKIVQEAFGSGSHVLAAIIERMGDMYLKQDLAKTAVAQFNYALLILQGAGKSDSAAAQALQAKVAKLSQTQEANKQ